MATSAQINILIDTSQAGKKVQDLNKEIYTSVGLSASLKSELKKITQELQKLEPGSQRFDELSQRAGQLRDTIQDTNAVINATAGNVTENLGKGLQSTLSIGVAGFQALTAAQSIFGTENEDLHKTIVRLQAAMNLSMAIETFGGLGDKVTAIKASFLGLAQTLGIVTVAQQATAVSATEVAVAEGAEAVSAEVATVATTGLAVSLNALPLVAVVTALGLLIAGLITYANSNSEAVEQEKKRKKALEDLEKQTKKNNEATKTHQDFILTETSAFIGLALQIQGSNKGTKERAKLITEINSTYGTTLKNLSNETLFQNQINQSIENYLKLAEAKYKLAQNQNKIDTIIAKKVKIEEGIAKMQLIGLDQSLEARKKLGDLIKQYGGDALSLTYQLQTVSAELTSITKESFKLGDAFTTLGSIYKINTGIVKDNTKELKDYDSILNKINATQEENKKQEEELYKLRSETFDKTINLVDSEQKIREEASVKEYEAVKISINKELQAKKISQEETKKLNELSLLNEQNLTKALAIENERRQLNYEVSTSKILLENKKRLDYLKLEEEALQDEIRFGDGNTSDTKISLMERENRAYIKTIDTKLITSKYVNKVELEEFEMLQNQKLDLILDNLSLESENKLKIAQSDLIRQIDLEKIRIENDNDLNVEIIKNANGTSSAIIEIKDKEIKTIAEMDSKARLNKLNEQILIISNLESQIETTTDINKKAALQIQKNDADAALQTFNTNIILADDLADIRIKTQENLNNTIESLEYEKNVKIIEANSELNETIKVETIKTEDEILGEKINRLESWLLYARQQFETVSSIIYDFERQQQEIRTQQLNDSIANDRSKIESAYASQLISRTEYDYKIAQLDQKQQQKQLAIDRKNFKSDKALKVVGATMDGAAAVLSAFAYTTGGPIIKGVAAALAGVFAATQIALISRQEFKAADGGIVPGNGSGEIDSVPSRLAPGEAVINSKSSAAWLPILSLLNESMGGRSLMPDLPTSNQGQRFAPIFEPKQQMQPIRAYVVESDISSSQRRVNRIVNSTRF